MKRFLLPLIVFAACLCVPLIRAQENSDPPNASLSPREKDVLQALIFMARKQYTEAAQVYSKLSQETPKHRPDLHYLGPALLPDCPLDNPLEYVNRPVHFHPHFSHAS